MIAGDASVGNTNDTSTVSAGLGGGTIYAGTVEVTALNNSACTPNVNSVNATLAGGSGAVANNTDTTTANAMVANNTAIMAWNSAATNVVAITAQNTFTENVPSNGNTVSAGAGGLANGTAAVSNTVLNGTATVTIGNAVGIVVMNTLSPTNTDTRGILLSASSVLNSSDQVTLTSGGAIEGAGTNSDLNATLTNNVTVGSNDVFETNENIEVGTYTQVLAAHTSEVSTYGVAGVGDANATTGVTSNQTVTLGANTNLLAYGNIDLTAGDDDNPLANNSTTLSGAANAQAYVSGFVAVPIASATTNLTSDATLTVGAGDQIDSGENTTLAADTGSPSASASGIGHGYEVGFIPVTDGSSTPNTSTNSTVTLDGTITAGIFDQLDITIPNNNSTQPTFSEPDSPMFIASPFYSYTSSYDPSSVINNSDLSATDKQVLLTTVSSSPVEAMTLGNSTLPLTANGGNVTVNAGTLLGTATITAYGAPTIDITNNSDDYLVLGPIVIPSLAAGNVVYTGNATTAPYGMTVDQVNPDGTPDVNVQELYDSPVGNTSSGSGPAVIVTGDVNNLLGQVSLYNASGSIIQLATINANQVDISAPNAALVVDIPNGTEVTGQSPYSEFDSKMIWPGGDPATTVNLSADDAVAYVANALFNANGVFGTDNSDPDENGTLTRVLIGTVGDVKDDDVPSSALLNSIESHDIPPPLPDQPNGTGVLNGDYVREAGTSLVFYDANTGDNKTYTSSTGDSLTYTSSVASADSPVDEPYQMNTTNDDGEGYYPVVPVEPLSVTVGSFPSLPTPEAITGTLTSGSNSVTDLSSTNGLANGETVTGTGIPNGTTIQSVVYLPLTDQQLEAFSSTQIDGIFSTTELAIGQEVTGPGIQPGTTIKNFGSGFGSYIDLSLPLTASFTGYNITVMSLTLSAPALISGSDESLSFASSAINAAKVIIQANVIDLDSVVNVGLPNNWSVDLPSSLTSIINQDHAQGGSTLYDLPMLSTVSYGDNQITAQYDAINNQIIVNNVHASSGAGFLSLDGAIINTTNQSGNIQVNDGNGQVTIDNETGVPVEVNNVNAGSGSLNTTPPSEVDIIDTKQPSATQQTLYVYNPGAGIDKYQGTAQDTMQQLAPVSSTNGTSTSYSPLSGLRYEWTLFANLSRTITKESDNNHLPVFDATHWYFDTPTGETNANDPWYYGYSPNDPTPVVGGVSTPFGALVTFSLPVQGATSDTAFEEQITGTVTDWYTEGYIYHDGNFGFAPTIPDGSEDPWVYYFADQAQLTLIDSVKADNPISISFSGAAQSSVTIDSNGSVILAGNIANPYGTTAIYGRSITQTSTATITSNNLTLSANGVGTSAQPVSASLTAGGVLNVSSAGPVYLNLGSGALLGQVSAAVGSDVVINATGSLDPSPGASSSGYNVYANNLTLTSATGEVGTADAPLVIEASGVVNVSALGDIGLTQSSGDLEVGAIVSTSGNVTIAASDGKILNANGATWAQLVDSTLSQQVWQNLDLTDPTATENQTVTAFENGVNADYFAYWQLLDNGSVQNGVFMLNAMGLALYSEQAGQAQTPPISDPTAAQVQTYANNQYQNYVTFFNNNLAWNWMSLADFQTYNPNFSYQATSQQVSALEDNASWTVDQLMNTVPRVGLDPLAGAPVGIETPNISGEVVTLLANGSIGQLGSSSTFISKTDLQSGNLTPAQATALAKATGPGDVLEVGTNGQGQTVSVPYGHEPAGFTLTGIEVSATPQLFISSTRTLNLTAGGAIAIQATSQDLTLDKVTAMGAVNITAPGSILGSGTSNQISTPDDITLKAGTGTVGSPSVFLNVYDGGDTNVYVPPPNIYINGPTIAYVSGTFAGDTGGQQIADADFGAAGDQPAVYGETAFATIGAALSKIAPNGQVIVNAGTYTEDVSVNATKTLTITAGAAVTINSLASLAGTTVQICGTSLTVGDATSTTVAGVITGSGALIEQGSGTVTLSGTNTYTGTTTVLGGTLSVSADSNLGTAPTSATAGQLVLNGGTLQATASFTLSSKRGIALGPTSGSGGGTIDVTSGVALTYGGSLANNGSGTGVSPRSIAARCPSRVPALTRAPPPSVPER